jgi:hypothetical protein
VKRALVGQALAHLPVLYFFCFATRARRTPGYKFENDEALSDEHVKVSASSCKLSSPTNFDNCKLLSLKSFSFLIQIFRFSLQE